VPTIEIKSEKNELVLSGALTHETVTSAFEKTSYALLVKKDHVLNLASVTKIDTAGLAWLLVMLEHAVSRSISLKFSHISKELMKLAKLTAVDSFLPVE